MVQKYVVMTPTLCQGDIIGCWGDDDTPVLYDTKEDAWKEIADDLITGLKQFIDGDRTLDETSFSPDDFVMLVMVDDDGMIRCQEGILFDPKIGRT